MESYKHGQELLLQQISVSYSKFISLSISEDKKLKALTWI